MKLSKEYLLEHYILRNKSIRYIADENNISKTTVEKYLRVYNIHKPVEKQKQSVLLTSQRNYGTDHPSQANPVKAKLIKTCK